jgi:hypothetical protein
LIQSPRSPLPLVFEDRHLEKSSTTLPQCRRATVVPPRPVRTPQLPVAPPPLDSAAARSNAGAPNLKSWPPRPRDPSTKSWPQRLPHLLRCNTDAALLTGEMGAATVCSLIGLGGHHPIALCSRRPTLAAGDRPGLTSPSTCFWYC